MIDLRNETVVTFRDAAMRLPRRRAGRKTSVTTIYRWATAGLRGTRLESIQIGGSSCTSIEALQRFFDMLTSSDGTASISAVRNSAEDQEIEEKLKRTGW